MTRLIQAIKNRLVAVSKIPALNSSSDWRYLIAAAILIIIGGLINYEVRQNQWQHWQENPHIFFADGQPLVSTTDAGYFLSYANDYRDGVSFDRFKSSRLYPQLAFHNPNKTPNQNNQDTNNPRSVLDYPLLSVITAEIADTFFNGDLITAANAIIPLTAFLTAIAIGAMFWAAGFPAEGAIAATGFGLSIGYLVRTSIGRIDTDQLILCFLAIILTFIIYACRTTSFRKMLGFILLAALAFLIFRWWYASSLLAKLLTALVPVIIASGIFAHKLNWKYALAALATFILAIGPIQFLNATRTTFRYATKNVLPNYINTAPPSSANPETLKFPNTLETITELAQIDLFAILGASANHLAIGIIGAIGFIAFSILKPKIGIVFMPIFLLGALALLVGQRLGIYAAPFIWFGAAWVTLSLARSTAQFAPQNFTKDALTLTVASIALITVAKISPTHYIPPPTFSSQTIQTFAQIKSLNQQKPSIVATWWDYGYIAHFKTGAATLHDGGTQRTPRTHLFARALLTQNTNETIQIIKYLATNTNRNIKKNSANLKSLNTAISNAQMPDKNTYIVVTQQMARWITSIATLGRFDTERGTSPSQHILNGFLFHQFNCSTINGDKLNCRQGLIDLTHGTLDGNPLIQKAVETVDGKILNQIQYQNNGSFILLIARNQNTEPTIKLIPEPTWLSAFTQLFEVANFNSNRLQLIIDNYPHGRVYKIIQ